MNTTPPQAKIPCPSGPRALSLTGAILLPVALGLAGGYLDVLIIIFRKYCWNELESFGSGVDFPWSVPLGHAALLLIPGVLMAAFNRVRPRPISLSVGAWLFATLAIWAALLRLPLYGASHPAPGRRAGRPISGRVAAHSNARGARSLTLAGLLGLLGRRWRPLSSGWQGGPGISRRGRIADAARRALATSC